MPAFEQPRAPSQCSLILFLPRFPSSPTAFASPALQGTRTLPILLPEVRTGPKTVVPMTVQGFPPNASPDVSGWSVKKQISNHGLNAGACSRWYSHRLNSAFDLSPRTPIVSHLHAWEAKTKARKKSRKPRSPSLNRNPAADAKGSPQPRRNRALSTRPGVHQCKKPSLIGGLFCAIAGNLFFPGSQLAYISKPVSFSRSSQTMRKRAADRILSKDSSHLG